MSLGQRLKPLAKFDDLSRLIKKNDLKSFFHITNHVNNEHYLLYIKS